jgi:oligopeptide transport system permease protein
MLLADIFQSLPMIMFVVIILLIFRNAQSPTWFHGLLTLDLGFAAISWVSLARLVRANVQQLRSRPFIEAAASLGASKFEIITRHLFPNVFNVVLAWVINNIPAVILVEAALGYIGVGVTGAVDGGEFTVVSWGGLFFAGRSSMVSNPVMLILPSLGVLLMSVSFILLANFLNEAYGLE